MQETYPKLTKGFYENDTWNVKNFNHWEMKKYTSIYIYEIKRLLCLFISAY